MGGFPNPLIAEEADAYTRVILDGHEVMAALTAVNDNKIEDEWNEQRPIGQSGAVYVFKGTKPPSPIKCTFTMTTAEEFADMMENVYPMLAPKPGLQGTGTAPAKPGDKFAIGAPAKADPSGGASGGTATTPATTPAAGSSSAGSGTSSSAAGVDASGFPTAGQATPNPGPKPPTVRIDNAYFALFGIAAVSRKSWDGPKETDTRGWTVDITFVPQKAPVPAGVGVAPPPGSQFAAGAAGNAGGGAAADPTATAKKVEQDGAGT